MATILIIDHSQTGNTQKMALAIADERPKIILAYDTF